MIRVIHQGIRLYIDPADVLYAQRPDDEHDAVARLQGGAVKLPCKTSLSLLAGLVDEVATRFDIDEDTAESLIDETASIYDIDSNVEPEDMADASWDIQHYTARAAKLLGFRAVAVSDEQGTAYLVDMIGHESELVKA